MNTKIVKILVVILIPLIFYIWGVATVQFKYFPYAKIVELKEKLTGSQSKSNNELNTFWANELKKGGYLLYFRHSQRNNIDLIVAYDAFQLINENKAETLTCLSSQGKIDAKLIGEIIRIIGIPIGQIISSPICRSKEMAKIAFGRSDALESAFIYRNIINVEQYKRHSEKIKKALIKYKPDSRGNTVITAHTSTLEFYCEDNFESCSKEIFSGGIDEYGFYIIESNNGSLSLRHKFKSFNDFVVASNITQGLLNNE